MPVLLLARGDQEARNLLRSAIEARYGVSPPAIDNVIIRFNGRVRAKVGPIMTWVPVRSTARFRFPNAIRWDFSVRPVGVPVQRGIEAFDGSVYRQLRGNGQPEIIENEALIDSLQQRLWAIAAVLLTPLGEHFVKVEATGALSFNATNTQLDHTVMVHLRENHTVERVQVECLNPDSGKQQRFGLNLSQEQAPVSEIMMPRKIQAMWDNQPYFEVQPTEIENVPSIADDIFTLQAAVDQA